MTPTDIRNGTVAMEHIPRWLAAFRPGTRREMQVENGRDITTYPPVVRTGVVIRLLDVVVDMFGAAYPDETIVHEVEASTFPAAVEEMEWRLYQAAKSRTRKKRTR